MSDRQRQTTIAVGSISVVYKYPPGYYTKSTLGDYTKSLPVSVETNTSRK